MTRQGATVARLRAGATADSAAALTALLGAAVCVIVTIGLTAGQFGGHGPYALALAAFALVALACLTHRRVDRTLVALALYLGLLDGYAKLSTGGNTVTLARDVLVLSIAVGAMLRSAPARSRIVLPPLGGLVVAFSVLVLIELANPHSRGLTAGLAGLRQHLEFMPLFFLGYAFVRSDSQIRKALVVLVFCAAVGGVVSFIQSRLTPVEFAAWGPGYSQRVLGTGIFSGSGRVAFVNGGRAAVRPFGLGSDSGAGAALAALGLPGLVALLMVTKGRIRWAVAPMSVGIGLAVATSGSRAAIVTSVVTLLAFGLIAAASKNGLRAMIGVAGGVAILYVTAAQLGPMNATSQRAKSIAPSKVLSTFATERGASVGLFPGLAESHPLGVGVGTVGPAAGFGQAARGVTRFNSEDEWNFLVIETGIAGVLIYVTLMLRLAWLSATRIRRVPDPSARLCLAALAAPLVGMLAADFSGPTSAAPPTAPYLWLASGVLAYRLVTAYRPNPAQHTVEALPAGMTRV